MTDKSIFCNGNFCTRYDRKNKCFKCGIWICGKCTYFISKKAFCFDCGIIEDLNKNFEDMEKEINETFDKGINEIKEEFIV